MPGRPRPEAGTLCCTRRKRDSAGASSSQTRDRVRLLLCVATFELVVRIARLNYSPRLHCFWHCRSKGNPLRNGLDAGLVHYSGAMRSLRLACSVAAFALIFSALPFFAQSPAYKYIRVGNAADAHATPRAGFALMGGGEDLDEAFRFLCDRSGGGDFIVLRSHGDDDYNPYIEKLCKLNSVATIIIPSRAAAADPVVAEKIRHASAIFIAGGDQGEYINFWMGTPVQAALNDAIHRGIPMGGTSAGLAVLGEYIYTSLGDKPNDPNLDGKTAMADPFGTRVALTHGFLDIPTLKGVITDTHFATRNRMGRLLTFLARLNKPGAAVRGIGVEQRAAVLLEPDGRATVVGHGAAYFIDARGASGTVAKGTPLSFGPYAVQKVGPGHAFNVKTWTGDATHYTLSVEGGAIHSTEAGNAVY